jgi:hypothetical protein
MILQATIVTPIGPLQGGVGPCEYGLPHDSNLSCEDRPSRHICARLTKNTIPKILWEKGHGQKSTHTNLTYTCSNS